MSQFASLSIMHLVLYLALAVWSCEGVFNGPLLAYPPVPIGDKDVAPDVFIASQDGTELPPYNTTYYFDQLIDHKDPTKGTFQMRYYFTWERYQPGGPIILLTPGEDDLEFYSGYITNSTLPGLVSQALHGANVVVEHRFFGQSNPGPDLSAKSLALLTLEQAIEDLVYFAQNVKLPMPGGDSVGPDKAPWLLFGSSYSGALTAWTMQSHPGVFWAGYASSAVVQAVNYFWSYFDPIRQFMPANCSADVTAVVSHFDHVLLTGTKEEQKALKDSFGLFGVTHNDDAGQALVNIFADWQYQRFTPDGSSAFIEFCDAIEVDDSSGKIAPAEGFGLELGLKAWARYYSRVYVPSACTDYNYTASQCFGSYNLSQSGWRDTSLGQWSRSWFWMICNEFGWWQTGAPEGWPSLVTRLAPPSFWLRQCVQLWPEYFKVPPTPNVDGINQKYGGWDISVDRLFFANGQRDPWRDVTVSSDFHFRKSTARQPIYISEGYHSNDMRTPNGVANPSVKAVQNLAIAHMGLWVQEWRALHPGVPDISNFTTPDPSQLPLPPAFAPATIPEDIIKAPPPPLPPNFPTTPDY